MKVLWVVNVPTAGAAEVSGLEASPFAGWLDGAIQHLQATGDPQVSVAFPSNVGNGYIGKLGDTEYWRFDHISRRHSLSSGLKTAIRILAESSPDLVHIHGTELPHCLSFTTAARHRQIPVVTSVQGLVSHFGPYLAIGLPRRVIHGRSRRFWERSSSVSGSRHAYRLQGEIEREALRRTDHVIGRTSWDRASVLAVNPRLTYHHCDETLRPEFYAGLEESAPVGEETGSIFVAQGHYPIKGLHMMLNALPLVRRQFPNAHLAIAGRPAQSLAHQPYNRFIVQLIEKLGLKNNVEFVGELSASEMVASYRRAAITVSPSLLENSSNSVCEASVLGRPIVASNVGGTADLIAHNSSGLLYQSTEAQMLAQSIESLMGDRDLAHRLGSTAAKGAIARHDPVANAATTRAIYRQVTQESE